MYLKMIIKFSTSLLFFAISTEAANILAILPTPSYSHQIAYTRIWKELSLRGHKVTLITTDPLKDPKLTNLTEINMKSSYKFFDDIRDKIQNGFTMWNMHDIFGDLTFKVANTQLTHPDVQDLIHNKDRFDVVLVEFIYPEYLAFAEIYNCPKIIVCSLEPTSIFYAALGNPITPALYPEIGATFHGSLNFKDRVISTLYMWYATYVYSQKIFINKTELVRTYFNVSKTVQEMINDVDVMFLSTNSLLQPIRALGPSTITIGGNREEVALKPLPKEVADFLDSAKNGFIYFSLGSNVKSEDLIKESKDAIIETLRELPYKVLWKFEADELPNKPENVKLIKWAPQETVLSHPNIKLFVTQGGLQSMEEGIDRTVPFVVIPFFADQDQNAKVMESKGIAIIVNREPHIRKEELKNAILEAIHNPIYKNSVKRLKHLISDSPMTGLEKAVWWTEYVIRHKGAKHLRNPAADIPSYQYYLIDVLSFLILSGIFIIVTLYLTLKTIFRYMLHTFKFNYTLHSSKKKLQ